MSELESRIPTDTSFESKETNSSYDFDSSDNVQNERIIKSIAFNLQAIIRESQVNAEYIKYDNFYSWNVPCITIEDYLKRIVRYTQMEISTLIKTILYLDKLCQMNKYVLCINNVYRLVITASLISIKFNEDEVFSNAYYAQVGGISSEEMNQLEYEFFVMMDLDLNIKEEYYLKYYSYFNRSSYEKKFQ